MHLFVLGCTGAHDSQNQAYPYFSSWHGDVNQTVYLTAYSTVASKATCVNDELVVRLSVFVNEVQGCLQTCFGRRFPTPLKWHPRYPETTMQWASTLTPASRQLTSDSAMEARRVISLQVSTSKLHSSCSCQMALSLRCSCCSNWIVNQYTSGCNDLYSFERPAQNMIASCGFTKDGCKWWWSTCGPHLRMACQADVRRFGSPEPWVPDVCAVPDC